MERSMTINEIKEYLHSKLPGVEVLCLDRLTWCLFMKAKIDGQVYSLDFRILRLNHDSDYEIHCVRGSGFDLRRHPDEILKRMTEVLNEIIRDIFLQYFE